jgi:periplasmic protein CpxP/Spy
MSEKQGATHKRWFRSANRKMIALVIGSAVAIGAIFGVQAVANSTSYEHLKLYASYNGGWRGGDHKRFAELSDSEIESRIERIVKHVAIEIDATHEQQEMIITLASAVARELKPVHGRMHASGKELQELLRAEVIDRAALERLRAERFADAEQISKTLTVALADVAEVLSLEQRKVLDERVNQFRSKHRGGRHD